MRRICILALPQVFDSALAITRDVLEAGRRLPSDPEADDGSSPQPFEVELVTVDGRSAVTAGGLRIPAGRSLAAVEDATLVLIPGFTLPGEESPEALSSYLEQPKIRRAVRALRAFRGRGGCLAAGCTATFVLGETGLLDGLQATTSWWLAEVFRERFPAVDLQPHMMVTSHNGIVCAGAALAHTDLALRVLGDLRGPSVSDRVARYLLLDERVSQGRYMASDHLSHRHPDVSRAEAWIREHLSESIRVDDVASAVALSPRTLARRIHESTGESPLSFIQRLRTEHAIHLLETSTLAFDDIAARVGYHEPAGLRRVLRGRTGKRPSDFRRRAVG